MSWLYVDSLTLTKNWIILPSNNTTFRIKHFLSSYDGKYLKAVVAKAFSNPISIYNPQRLSYRQQEYEVFYFPKDILGDGLGFIRLDNTDIEWSIEIEIYQENMFYTSTNKQQATNAQPANDVSVTNSKTLVVSDKADGTRRSCLVTNTGPSTVYFKYVPLGTDPTATTVIVSATNYDFTLAAGEKFLDDNSSQNAIVGICLVATAKVKVTEYIYS